ncbi:MAG TPA: hypothetical protein VMV38_01220 [Candidatus Paceibacterota bacterium]|nr:hypothetical protein [Candidatus Paceibacterota bacterium]
MEKNSPKLELALFDSYRAAIKNSVGSNIYRNLYFHSNGTLVDILDDGDLSCAFFVTTILYLFGLITERHTTVKSALEDIRKSGWYEIKEPRAGALIHWDYNKKDDGTQGKHHHLGFYIDAEHAISNDSPSRVVAVHHPTYGTFPDGKARRDILAYYWHDNLTN